MKIIKASNGKKTIKMSRTEWESIGSRAGWIKEAEISHYIETYINGEQMLGSDGTTVLHPPQFRNLTRYIKQRIEILKGLSINIRPDIKTADSVILKVVNRAGDVLKTVDVTEAVR